VLRKSHQLNFPTKLLRAAKLQTESNSMEKNFTDDLKTVLETKLGQVNRGPKIVIH
jgi:hypothetical protein